MADLETSSEDVQTIIKDKMTEVIRITDKNKNKCCLWKCMMIQGLKVVIIPWIIRKDISLSSSQQDGYSSSKFKDIVYPTLKKWSLIYWHTLSPSHLINIWTDCKHGLNSPGKYLLHRCLNIHVILTHSLVITDSQFVGWRVAFGWPRPCPLS